jgi:hypothetical protein
MEIPALKDGWDAITGALQTGRFADAKTAAKSFRAMCFAGGDLTLTDAALLVDEADRKVGLTTGSAALRVEGMTVSLRSLDLYGEPGASMPHG